MRDTESNHATFLFFCAMKADHNEGLGSGEEMLILAPSLTNLFGASVSMGEAIGKYHQMPVTTGEMSNTMFDEGLNSANWLGRNCDKSRLKDIFGVIEELVYSDGSLRGKEGVFMSKVKTIWGV